MARLMFRFHYKCKVSYNGFKCLELILYKINNYLTTISVNLQHGDRVVDKGLVL